MRRLEFSVVLAKIFKKLIETSVYFLRYRARYRLMSNLIESLEPVITTKTKHGDIKFYCPATWPLMRSTYKGQPVLDWIDGFSECEIFWDIGANIGSYTLYAAKRKLKVVAFEPSSSAHFILVKNIEINNFEDAVCSLNIALHEKTVLSNLWMSSTVVGASQHTFGIESSNRRKQAVLGYSVDEFIKQFYPNFPSHIKIDVDGNEGLVLKGAKLTLGDKRLQSMMVEVRDDTRDEVEVAATHAGFVCVSNGQHKGVEDMLFKRAVLLGDPDQPKQSI